MGGPYYRTEAQAVSDHDPLDGLRSQIFALQEQIRDFRSQMTIGIVVIMGLVSYLIYKLT